MFAKILVHILGIRRRVFLNIMINKEYLDDLHKCTEENINFLSTAINMYLHEDELVSCLEGKLNEIMYLITRAYNPELIELKQRSRMYYQKWLKLKDTDKTTANAVYLEYLDVKFKIDTIEIPF